MISCYFRSSPSKRLNSRTCATIIFLLFFSRRSHLQQAGSVPNLYFDPGDIDEGHPDYDDLLQQQGSSVAGSRFGDEFSLQERRVRILDMVSEICDIPPMIQGVRQMGGSSSAVGCGSITTTGRNSSLGRRSKSPSLAREQARSIQREGKKN